MKMLWFARLNLSQQQSAKARRLFNGSRRVGLHAFFIVFRFVQGFGMFELDNGAKLPPARESKLPDNVQLACDTYADLYFKLYRAKATFEYTEDGYIRINGKPGVKLARMRIQ